ncbi:MAG: DUF2007 domain-containing protein [Deltaproteobacteria bacterium]|nr:DUF2007 domain-containing protein [Deltaproteobacteria bacterium]
MAAQLVPVLQCRDLQEAQLAQGKLASEGIAAFLENEYTVGLVWTWSNAIGGVRVLVPEARADEARALLAADAASQVEALFPTAVPDRCPACGSLAVSRRRRVRTAAALALLVYVPLPVWGASLSCDACGARWQLPSEPFPDVPAAGERTLPRGRLFAWWFRRQIPWVMLVLLALIVFGMTYEYARRR